MLSSRALRILLLALAGLAVAAAYAMLLAAARAHLAQATPEMNEWLSQQSNGRGDMCCSSADGSTIPDVDWQTTPDGKHYQVRLEGQWRDVDDNKVVTAPNRFGPAVVWTYRTQAAIGGRLEIRCFMPGAGA